MKKQTDFMIKYINVTREYFSNKFSYKQIKHESL